MKKITVFFLVLSLDIIILLSSGCKKMLEIPDNAPGQLITSQVFTDSATAISGVVGIYVNAVSSGQGPLSLDMSLYPSRSADDLITSSSTDVFSNNALIAGSDAQPGGSTGFIWNSFYNNTLIYQTNAAIEGIEASNTLSSTLKDQLIGECKFLRALSYFYLVNLYGPVPIVITTDYKVNIKLPRAPVDTVYKQITKDLVDASNRLLITYPTTGRARPNKYTAMALLSRVYLYRQEWSQAEATADEIINSGNYSLEALENVFLIDNQEAIWQTLSLGYYSYATYEGITFVPYATNIIPQYYLTDFLLNAFEPGDQRASYWIAANTVDGVDYYYPYKYKNSYSQQVNGTIEGEVLFRLAEQYLIRAESKIQLGNLDGGAQDLNLIRNRAGLPNTTASSKEDLLAAVAHERQTEFFCEWGHRWLDLKRTGTINAVMSQEKPNTWPQDGHAVFYPLPYDQFHLNPGWSQNTGY